MIRILDLVTPFDLQIMACAHRGRSKTAALSEQIKDIIVLTAGLQHIVHHLEIEHNNLEAENLSLQATQ